MTNLLVAVTKETGLLLFDEAALAHEMARMSEAIRRDDTDEITKTGTQLRQRSEGLRQMVLAALDRLSKLGIKPQEPAGPRLKGDNDVS